MDTFKRIKRKENFNKIRTKLLILANDEITRIKKTNFTKINSRNLIDFEKYYAELDMNKYIELKEEKFNSRDYTDIIHKNKTKDKFILKSPDGSYFNFIQNKDKGEFDTISSSNDKKIFENKK